jgi:protein O-GlcNAc transferase
MLYIIFFILKTLKSMNKEKINILIKTSITLFNQNKLDLAKNTLFKALEVDQKNSLIYEVIGVIFLKQNDLIESEKYLNLALNLNRNASTLNNLGLLFKNKKQYSESLRLFKEAIILNKNLIDPYINIINIYIIKEQFEDGIIFLEQNKNLLKEDNRYFEKAGYLNFRLNKFNKAKLYYLEAYNIKQNDFNTVLFLGLAYNKLRENINSIKYLKKALEINPNSQECIKALGAVYLETNQYNLAKEKFEKVLDINNKIDLFGSLNFVNRKIANWDNYQYEKSEIEKQILVGKNQDAIITPFAANTLLDNPSLIFKATQQWVKKIFKDENIYKFNYNPKKNNKIILAYFSSDFYNHATSYLFKDVIKYHNKNKFEIHAFSSKIFPDDDTTNELKKNFDFFHEISNIEDDKIIELSNNFKIDIAINLNGFTKYNKNQCFFSRIAPVQINYLGFPGSMALKNMDYIIVDKYLINSKNNNFFTEKKIFLPTCYQPNSAYNLNKIKELDQVSNTSKTNQFSIGCFCSPDKIAPSIFDIWLRVLQNFDNTLFHLIKHNDEFEINIKKYISSKYPSLLNKFIFLEKNIDHEKHLANHNNIDLFVDTYPCNGHTTTSDIILFEKPLITISGNTFPSRVAGSILTEVGLKNLICNDLEEYESKINYYIKNNHELKKLVKSINNKKLFNVKDYTVCLENAYQRAYELRVENKFEDIYV